MKKIVFLTLAFCLNGLAQEPLSIEKLWQLKRLSPIGLTTDNKEVIYSVTTPNVANNNFEKRYFQTSLQTQQTTEISSDAVKKFTQKISVDGDLLTHKSVKITPTNAVDFYSDLPHSSGQLFTSLDYRHWDKWNEGEYNHIFIQNTENQEIDIMEGLPYYAPQEPFGGDEDYIWSPDGKKVLYVTKAKAGNDYVNSTNTDIYEYNITSKETKNLTKGLLGYDTNPQFSSKGILAWLSMKTDGNEADKNDILILLNHGKQIKNTTENWDNTVLSYRWSNNGKSIFLTAATDGTIQLFELFPFEKKLKINQLTNGHFDINDIVGQSGNQLIITRSSINRAKEIFSLDLKTKKFTQITNTNDEAYQNIAHCKTEKRYITTTDGKKMLTWVIYPPNFDPNKKYPTLLYCQGGPQSPLTQFYSFRWNFQLMASQGYIVVAPNRRGMPGHGVQWNAQISKDWGGQVMKDYLSAIDALAQEPFVDEHRLGAIGASYGGYSVFYLAGIHQNRFKTFISHCGVFNLKSMYGTTEEKFFNNNEMGGAYWENTPETNRSYNDFNPINFVNQWNTPILIIQGGKDFRVPEEQAFQAFTAAQQKGIKSKFLYFPDENHWVLQPQNGIFWQRNFYQWLKETL